MSDLTLLADTLPDIFVSSGCRLDDSWLTQLGLLCYNCCLVWDAMPVLFLIGWLFIYFMWLQPVWRQHKSKPCFLPARQPWANFIGSLSSDFLLCDTSVCTLHKRGVRTKWELMWHSWQANNRYSRKCALPLYPLLHLLEDFPSGFFCGDKKEILIMVCPLPSIAD